jgi:zinc transporter ZupT
MVGNWKINISIGLVAFICTLLFSLPNNTWQTTIFRGVIGFIIFFLLGFLIRTLFFQIFASKTKQVIVNDSKPENEAAPLKEEESNEIAFDDQFESIPLHALHQEGKTNDF